MVAWTGIEGRDSGISCALDDKCGEGVMVRKEPVSAFAFKCVGFGMPIRQVEMSRRQLEM